MTTDERIGEYQTVVCKACGGSGREAIYRSEAGPPDSVIDCSDCDGIGEIEIEIDRSGE